MSKARMSLLPWHALVQVAAILEMGGKKYNDPDGLLWRKVTTESDNIDAAIRHLAQVCHPGLGEFDDESGLLALAHAACRLLMALEQTCTRLGNEPMDPINSCDFS